MERRKKYNQHDNAFYLLKYAIVHAKKYYYEKFKTELTDIYLTDKEYKIIKNASKSDVGTVLHEELKRKNPKIIFTQFMGLNPHWNSKEFYLSDKRNQQRVVPLHFVSVE